MADAFSALMARAEEAGIIDGFKASVGAQTVSHLQFVDDTLCFVEAGAEQVFNLKTILDIYECISSLKVNLLKSCMAGIGVDGMMLSNHARVIECKLVDWPLKYLGMTLGGNPWSISFFLRPSSGKEFTKSWRGWKKSYISLGAHYLNKGCFVKCVSVLHVNFQDA